MVASVGRRGHPARSECPPVGAKWTGRAHYYYSSSLIIIVVLVVVVVVLAARIEIRIRIIIIWPAKTS